jgi:preprotein translocase subunit SecF
MGVLQRIHRGENVVDFPRMWRPAVIVSTLLLLLGLVSIVTRGFNWSIDFEGGTQWEVRAPGVSVAEARDFLRPLGEGEAKIQIVDGEVLRIQSELKDPDRASQIGQELGQLGNVESVNSVGPTWGEEITEKAIRALVIFTVLVAAYIAWRLEWRMAIASIVAMAHDVLLSIAVYSILGLLVSPATVISFLTILGYSLYDTVIVFDKARELTARPGLVNRHTYTDILNLSLNQVITRSIGTTLVAVLPVLTLYVVGSIALGASTLQEFSLALLVGLVTGTYSSVFVASPIVAFLKEREPRHREVRLRLAQRGALEGGTVMLDAREVGGLTASPTPTRRPAKGGGAPARPAPASTTASSTARTATATDQPGADRPAPSGAIPPRPRKKKRR